MNINNIFSKKAKVVIKAVHDNYMNSIFISDDKGNVIYPKYEIINGITQIEEINRSNYPDEVLKLIDIINAQKNYTFFEFLEIVNNVQNLNFKVFFAFCGYTLNSLRNEHDNYILYSLYENEYYNELPIRESEINDILTGNSQFKKAANISYCINDDSLYILSKDDWKMRLLENDNSRFYEFLIKNID
jgi:hypothetical protein